MTRLVITTTIAERTPVTTIGTMKTRPIMPD